MVIRLANKLLAYAGLEIGKKDKPLDADLLADAHFMSLFRQVQPYTMTSAERLYALHKAVIYTIGKGLPGAFVECGVWKGGSSMMIALTLRQLGITDRDLYLYDTFEGMSTPTENDVSIVGDKADVMLEQNDKSAGIWAYSALEEVKANMQITGYPADRIHYVKGKVEDTIPGVIPASIALLRLDTDWYESTRHELIHLYPLLASQGMMIIDDFGHWEGAKKAVMEYFEGQPLLLNRLDYTGRSMLKM
jgi:O-methyltransferase